MTINRSPQPQFYLKIFFLLHTSFHLVVEIFYIQVPDYFRITGGYDRVEGVPPT